MLKIRCTSLEDISKSPLAYAQLLANGDGKVNGGTYGMFACWQEVVKAIHLNELTISQGIKELQNKFLRFDDNPKNKQKQDLLIDQLVKYCKLYDKYEFAFADSKRQMKWQLHTDVMLTGLTPWVVYNDTGYYSYLVSEQSFDWQSQLRFPLIQQYLSDNNIVCDITEMNVGVYCLAASKFDFKSYSKIEIKQTITQVTSIFENVYDEYSKIKNKKTIYEIR